jgi:hypothetical protein
MVEDMLRMSMDARSSVPTLDLALALWQNAMAHAAAL